MPGNGESSNIVIDSYVSLSYPQLVKCLETPAMAPDTWPYNLLPAVIDAGELAKLGAELLQLSVTDPQKREAIFSAVVGLDSKLVLPDFKNAILELMKA
jgi:hypothetical protein